MFDINKPHIRRDGGDYEIVTLRDGHAFGFLIENDVKLPNWWIIDGDKLNHDKYGDNDFDIIQLPEEKEVVGWINVWDGRFGDPLTSNANRIKVTCGTPIGIIKTTAKIIDGKLVSVKSEIVE